jgi:hypothetical protein
MLLDGCDQQRNGNCGPHFSFVKVNPKCIFHGKHHVYMAKRIPGWKVQLGGSVSDSSRFYPQFFRKNCTNSVSNFGLVHRYAVMPVFERLLYTPFVEEGKTFLLRIACASGLPSTPMRGSVGLARD